MLARKLKSSTISSGQCSAAEGFPLSGAHSLPSEVSEAFADYSKQRFELVASSEPCRKHPFWNEMTMLKNPNVLIKEAELN
jgi:hypothetical protein